MEAEMARLARFGFAALALTLGFGFAQAEDKEGRKDKDEKKEEKPTPTAAHGANFQIKSQIDNNFCIAVAGGTNEGRLITLQQCGSADTQRWAFTWNADESNVIVESQGMCLDGRARKGGDGQSLPVQKCRFGDAWRFTVIASGLIKDLQNKKCLSVPGAAANAAVSLVDCDESKKNDLWKLAH